MRPKIGLLLTFALLAISPPTTFGRAPVHSKSETAAKAKDYAIGTTFVLTENAAFENVFVYVAPGQDAAIKQAAILSKTPTVEVKAKATVEGRTYQRLCKTNSASNLKFTVRTTYFSNRIVHIDPGLRGC